MKKKILILFLLLVLSVSLASCAEAKITYGYYIFQSGEIFFTFEVEIDDVKNTNPSGIEYTPEMICEIIKSVFEGYGYDAEVAEDGMSVYAQRYFESRTDYNIFYGITGDEAPDGYDEDFYKEGGVFFNEYVAKRQTEFADIEEILNGCANGPAFSTDGILDEAEKAFIEGVKSDILALDYKLFLYVYKYETYYDSIDSNADVKVVDEETGLNAHIFYMDSETIGRVIEFRQKVPNITVWVLTALGISVFVVLAVYGIGSVFKKRD